MLLVLHITIAIFNVIFSSYVALAPSSDRLKLVYAFTGATFLTGFVLVFTRHVNILQVCVTGLLYLGFVLATVAIARRRLSSLKVD